LLGKDITRIDGFGSYLALKFVAECGDNLSAFRRQGTVVTNEALLEPWAALLRLAGVPSGRTDTAPGAFYRRLSARVGKAIAVGAGNACRRHLEHCQYGFQTVSAA